jgi:hypothetical protein
MIPPELQETYDRCSNHTKNMLNTLVPSVLILRLKAMKRGYDREK